MKQVFKNIIFIFILFLVLFITTNVYAEYYHKTSEVVNYKCLFNHELLIVTHKKNNSRKHIQYFIEKVKNTDVDVIMCCPTMLRMNLFPSEVAPEWKKYSPVQPLSKFPSYDYMMQYLHTGGDPVKDTLDACRQYGKDFFISYRMNDHHYVDDLAWPTHNAFWREHPEYWLGNSKESPYSKRDDVRLFNYHYTAVRDYYFSIIEELCTNYDLDGVELDFQRFPKFFLNSRLKEGTEIMTAFVNRIKTMLDRIGRERGKSLKLCVRVPETLAKCKKVGLDVSEWDRRGLVDMINLSSFYIHSIEIGLEEFRTNTKHAKIYGEMNYVTNQTTPSIRRFTTIEIYHASALNFFHRGADGLSLFNYDYVPVQFREPMAEGLNRITDIDYLRNLSKNYVVYPGFGTFPATDEQTIDLIIPDDTSKIKFGQSVLRIETKEICTNLQIGVWLNDANLDSCPHEGSELFTPLDRNPSYPLREKLKFYSVPLNLLVPGSNRIEIKNLDRNKKSCQFYSMELALYRPQGKVPRSAN